MFGGSNYFFPETLTEIFETCENLRNVEFELYNKGEAPHVKVTRNGLLEFEFRSDLHSPIYVKNLEKLILNCPVTFRVIVADTDIKLSSLHEIISDSHDTLEVFKCYGNSIDLKHYEALSTCTKLRELHIFSFEFPQGYDGQEIPTIPSVRLTLQSVEGARFLSHRYQRTLLCSLFSEHLADLTISDRLLIKNVDVMVELCPNLANLTIKSSDGLSAEEKLDLFIDVLNSCIPLQELRRINFDCLQKFITVGKIEKFYMNSQTLSIIEDYLTENEFQIEGYSCHFSDSICISERRRDE